MKRLFYFLSMTDPEFISLESAAYFRFQQITKGMLVFISGLFGCIVAAYAVWEVSRSPLLAVVGGVVYGVTTTFLGRMLVSVGEVETPTYVFLLVLLLMTISSFILAIPLQLRIFDSEIRREITNSQTYKTELQKRRALLEQELAECRKTSNSLGAKLDEEATGRIGQGTTGLRGFGSVYQHLRERYESNQLRCNELTAKAESARKEEISYVAYADDFLSRLGVLKDILSKSRPAFGAFWMMALLLIIVQCSPLLVGLLSNNTAYLRLVRQWRARIEEATAKQISEFSFTPSVNVNAFSEVNAYPGLTLPSFGSGFASAMDWFGDLAPTIKEFRGGEKTLDEARDAAIARDWAMIGRDLQKVLDKHGEEPAKPAA